MKQIIFNDGNLTNEQINKVVKKVRAFVIHRQTQKALLVHYAGLYMLPGGSIDDGENDIEALRRELLEETGIEIKEEEAIPYLSINSYDKNYFDRKSGTINRLTQTTFFKIITNQDIDETRKNLTESEKEKGHTVEYTNLSVMRYLIETNITNNPKREQFDREILAALNEFAQQERMSKSEKSEDILK